MTNNITYTGRVTIKIKNKPPVRTCNEGTTLFFSLLCNILSGNLTTDVKNYLPVKIAMIHDNNGSITSNMLEKKLSFSNYLNASLLISDLNITARQVNSNTSSVYFSALLAHSQLKTSAKISAQSSKKCYVLLLNNLDTENILAYAPFDYNDIRAIWEDVNGQGAVDWEMFFANKEANK